MDLAQLLLEILVSVLICLHIVVLWVLLPKRIGTWLISPNGSDIIDKIKLKIIESVKDELKNSKDNLKSEFKEIFKNDLMPELVKSMETMFPEESEQPVVAPTYNFSNGTSDPKAAANKSVIVRQEKAARMAILIEGLSQLTGLAPALAKPMAKLAMSSPNYAMGLIANQFVRRQGRQMTPDEQVQIWYLLTGQDASQPQNPLATEQGQMIAKIVRPPDEEGGPTPKA